MIQTRRFKFYWPLSLALCMGIVDPGGHAAVAQSASPTAKICPGDLGTAMDAIADQPQFQRARWGILVAPLTGSTATVPLYARNAEQYFIPASTVKLFTTAAALQQLGPNFRIRTSVYQEPTSATDITLRVVGRGDPSFSTAHLTALTQQLQQQGIQQVNRLLGDDTYFQGPLVNATWEWEDVQANYGAPVNSLNLNQNAVTFNLLPQAIGEPLRLVWNNPADAQRWRVENNSTTVPTTEAEILDVGRAFDQPLIRIRGQLHVGSEPADVGVAVPNPTQVFLQELRRSLQAAQIPVGPLGTIATPVTMGTEIAAVESPPLSQLLTTTNQSSNNLYAESLLRVLGAQQPSQDPSVTTAEAGLTAVKTTLTNLGIDPASFVQADGSGLSRRNLASPGALVQTLQSMAASPQAEIYHNSLAVAGSSGTLRNRFRDTPVTGQLWGKTGSLSGAASLAGYLDPPNYPPLVFSIMLNQSDQPASQMRQAIDQMVLVLAQVENCQ